MGNVQISKADKERLKRLDNIDAASVMLSLVNQYHDQLQAASKELILAICWEESFFQNIPQDNGPAAGYGQLERDGRRIANQHLTGDDADFSRGRVDCAGHSGVPSDEHPGRQSLSCWFVRPPRVAGRGAEGLRRRQATACERRASAALEGM